MTHDYRIERVNWNEWAIRHPRITYLYWTGSEWRDAYAQNGDGERLIQTFDSESDARLYAQLHLDGKELTS